MVAATPRYVYSESWAKNRLGKRSWPLRKRQAQSSRIKYQRRWRCGLFNSGAAPGVYLKTHLPLSISPQRCKERQTFVCVLNLCVLCILAVELITISCAQGARVNSYTLISLMYMELGGDLRSILTLMIKCCSDREVHLNMMKIMMILAIALLLPATFITFTNAAQEKASPDVAPPGASLSLAATRDDLGIVIPGVPVTRLYSIQNTGNQNLNVRLVRTSAPELVANLAQRDLAPGSRAELRVVLTSPSWRETGLFTGEILLYSNDPVKPLAKLKIRAVFESPLSWLPKGIEVPPLRAGQTPELPMIELASKDGSNIGPVSATSHVPYVTAQVVARSSVAYEIRLRLDPSVPPGLLSGWISIKTNHPQQPFVDIPFRTLVREDLIIQPYVLDFGVVEEGKPVTAMLTLVNLGDYPTAIMEIRTYLPTPVEFNLLQDGKDYQIQFTLAAPSGVQNLAGYINVITDHPNTPAVKIPTAGWVWSKHPFEQVTGADALRLPALVRGVLFSIPELDPDQFVNTVLGGVRDDRSASLLLRIMEDDNWLVRSRAIEVLGNLQSRMAWGAIRKAITDDLDDEVRRCAVVASGQIANIQAMPELLLALQDDDSWVRAEAAEVLGVLGDPRATAPLKQLAEQDGDEDVREKADDALRLIAEMTGSKP